MSPSSIPLLPFIQTRVCLLTLALINQSATTVVEQLEYFKHLLNN